MFLLTSLLSYPTISRSAVHSGSVYSYGGSTLFINFSDFANICTFCTKKISVKRDTRLLKVPDLTHKCSLRRDCWVSKKIWWGVKLFKGVRVECATKTCVWHYSAELKNCPLYCFDLLKLITLHDDIPSSSSWDIGKSGQINQSIRQGFDSMATTAQQAAVMTNTCHPSALIIYYVIAKLSPSPS